MQNPSAAVVVQLPTRHAVKAQANGTKSRDPERSACPVIKMNSFKRISTERPPVSLLSGVLRCCFSMENVSWVYAYIPDAPSR
jgi:hypothetical protein